MSCSNLWLRESGADPWEYDVIIMDVSADSWTYKRNARVGRTTSELLWTRNGVSYLRPEIQLLHKAPGLRAKDQEDFAACLPLLEAVDRRWLRSALEIAHPGHLWLLEL